MLLIVSALTMPLPIRFIFIAGDEVHFLVYRSSYLGEIAQIHADGEPKLAQFDLGGFPSTTTTAIVYDESDEIIQPAGKRSSGWNDKAGKVLYCEPEVLPFLRLGRLTEHFYLALFTC